MKRIIVTFSTVLTAAVACQPAHTPTLAPTLPPLTSTPAGTTALTPIPITLTVSPTSTSVPTATKTPVAWELTVQTVNRISGQLVYLLKQPPGGLLPSLDELNSCLTALGASTSVSCASKETIRSSVFGAGTMNFKDSSIPRVKVLIRNNSDGMRFFTLNDILLEGSDGKTISAAGFAVENGPIISMLPTVEIGVPPKSSWTITFDFWRVLSPQNQSGFQLHFLDLPPIKLLEPS